MAYIELTLFTYIRKINELQKYHTPTTYRWINCCGNYNQQNNKRKKNNTRLLKIGILQTASHPALDAAREGFIDTIKAKLGNNVECVISNAQDSILLMRM